MASELIMKYDQQLYQNKIDELQGYWNELNAHLDNIKNLRSQLPNFWNDENATETKQILDMTIDHTQFQMNLIQDTILMYKKVITELEAKGSAAGELLNAAFGILGGLK